jgi:D-glycero-alpha-D-manno-heptose-7-phosphate kinase
VTRALIARAPTRLDFGGGWTDVPPYTEREGGAVCNVAITRYATATVATGGHVAVRAHAPSAADDRLIHAALRRSSIAHVEARLESDYPVGAGLGGSSAAGVALAGALGALAGETRDPHALATLSRETEVEELGMPGGYQDHFAAAFGGALFLTFGESVAVQRIELGVEARASLARRGVLVYTGESRISGDTIIAVRNSYGAGERRVVNALRHMKSLAFQMAAALHAEDIDALGALVGEHWTHQRELHPSITTPRIDNIVETAARAGALGAKALGASGGGCVLAMAREGEEDSLVQALAPLGKRLSYAVDTTGFDVLALLEGQGSSDDDPQNDDDRSR